MQLLYSDDFCAKYVIYFHKKYTLQGARPLIHVGQLKFEGFLTQL